MNKTINTYIKNITEKEIKYKLLSSNEMLNNIDNIIVEFKKDNNSNELSNILLNTFGLLQALFVGVDSLYNLVISITKNKYYININQNYVMHELKFIRNDIVGHPTNRKYGSQGVGYSKIDSKNLTKDNLTYYTYVFRDKELIESNRTINFNQLIEAYTNEKNLIYDQLAFYIKSDYKNVDFSKEVYNLHLNLNLERINEIRTKFIKTYGKYEKHRFMWRLSLLEKAILWESNYNLIQELIEHIKTMQALKLYQISRNMENRSFKIPNIKVPKILRQFYSILNKNTKLISYIHNLNDPNHPFYEADLDYLISQIDHKNVKELLIYTKNLEDNEKSYLIGALLKQYRTKNI